MQVSLKSMQELGAISGRSGHFNEGFGSASGLLAEIYSSTKPPSNPLAMLPSQSEGAQGHGLFGRHF